MPSTSSIIKACLKYDAMGLDVSGVIADVLHLDAVEVRMDKPCGKSHISDRKKCSPDKLKTLTADLKAGDEGAKRRVAEGKRSAQKKQQLNRAVQRDKGKKPVEIEPEWSKKLTALTDLDKNKPTVKQPKLKAPQSGNKEWDSAAVKERDEESATLKRLASPVTHLKPISAPITGRTAKAINKQLDGTGLTVAKSEYGHHFRVLDANNRIVATPGGIKETADYLNDPTAIHNRRTYQWNTTIKDVSDDVYSAERNADKFYHPNDLLGRGEYYANIPLAKVKKGEKRITRQQSHEYLRRFNDDKTFTEPGWSGQSDKPIDDYHKGIAQAIQKQHPDLIDKYPNSKHALRKAKTDSADLVSSLAAKYNLEASRVAAILGQRAS
jgi:hypothetical protein